MRNYTNTAVRQGTAAPGGQGSAVTDEIHATRDWSGEISGTAGVPGSAQGAPPPISELTQLNMSNGLPTAVIEAPLDMNEAYMGSLKAMLANNVGNYIQATFLVGTERLVTFEGVLYTVGNDYLTIYQESQDAYIVSDIYSLRFMQFFGPRRPESYDAITRRSMAGQGGQTAVPGQMGQMGRSGGSGGRY